MIPYFFSELPLRKDLSIRNPYELYHEISRMLRGSLQIHVYPTDVRPVETYMDINTSIAGIYFLLIKG